MSNSPSWTVGHSGIAFYALYNDIHSLASCCFDVGCVLFLQAVNWQGCRRWCFPHSSHVSSDNPGLPHGMNHRPVQSRSCSWRRQAVLLTRQQRFPGGFQTISSSPPSSATAARDRSQGPQRVRSADPEKQITPTPAFTCRTASIRHRLTGDSSARGGSTGPTGESLSVGILSVVPQQLGKSLKPPFSRNLADSGPQSTLSIRRRRTHSLVVPTAEATATPLPVLSFWSFFPLPIHPLSPPPRDKSGT